MKKFLKIIGNKYIIATLVFVVIIVFLDDYGLMTTSKLSRQVKKLHAEEEQMKKDIVQDSINAASLKGNLDAIEHYGRENYYMKRADEDIFVIK
jgi:cell division protein FtsB